MNTFPSLVPTHFSTIRYWTTGALLLSILLCASNAIHAQVDKDSLLDIWHDKTQDDSLRVEAYKDYILNGIMYSDPDSAYVMADELIKYASNKNYPIALFKAYSLKGIAQQGKGELIKALRFHRKAGAVSDSIGFELGIGWANLNIGNIFSSQGDSQKALAHYKIAQKVFDSKNKGQVYLYNNIGIIYDQIAEGDKALFYYNKVLKLLNDSDSHNILKTSVLVNIGQNQLMHGEYDKALRKMKEALELINKYNNLSGKAQILVHIGAAYDKLGKFKESLAYINSGIELAKEHGFDNVLSYGLHQLGITYLSQGKYNNALNKCLESYQMSKKVKDLLNQKANCQCIYDAYKGLGNSIKALEYYEKLNVVKDSIASLETQKNLQNMEFRNKLLLDSLANVEKERVLNQKHLEEVQQKNKTRNLLIGLAGLILLIAGGIYSRLRFTRKSKALIEKEKERSDNLLLNILPADIAEELKQYGKAEARDFENVSILFTDFKDFTQTSQKLKAQELVSEINVCFEAFDSICEEYGIEKIKTIGDAYMAAGGLPIPSEDSTANTVKAALAMQDFIHQRKEKRQEEHKFAFQMRAGIHTGPVVAGIVGTKKFQYDIWGDTVNTSSRIESHGEVGKLNISKSTYELIKDNPEFNFESRGSMDVKGKGEMEMFFVNLR